MAGVHTNTGIDHAARQVGGDDIGRTGTGAGVSYSATTCTDTGGTFPASTATNGNHNGGLVGHVIVVNNVYGVISNNTSTVLTVDFWHNATTPETTGSTPSNNTTYVVLPGGFASYWIGLSSASRAPAAADAFLTNDGTTISEIFGNTQAGLSRQRGTYSHTNGTTTFTLVKTFTCTAADGGGSGVQINKYGVFVHGITAAPTTTTSGVMIFTGAIPSPPTLLTNDTIQITETITIA